MSDDKAPRRIYIPEHTAEAMRGVMHHRWSTHREDFAELEEGELDEPARYRVRAYVLDERVVTWEEIVKVCDSEHSKMDLALKLRALGFWIEGLPDLF